VNEITRLKLRIESLRGLCKWASGRLLDVGDVDGADKVLELVGDAEKPELDLFADKKLEDEQASSYKKGWDDAMSVVDVDAE
jgi:hypothetical protein